MWLVLMPVGHVAKPKPHSPVTFGALMRSLVDTSVSIALHSPAWLPRWVAKLPIRLVARWLELRYLVAGRLP